MPGAVQLALFELPEQEKAVDGDVIVSSLLGFI